MNSPLIGARGVVKSFGQTPALRGADVQVAAGEILAVTDLPAGGESADLGAAAVGLAAAHAGHRPGAVRGRTAGHHGEEHRSLGLPGPAHRHDRADRRRAVPLAAATLVTAALAYGMSVLTVLRIAPPGTAVPLLGHVYFATMGAGLAIALVVIGVTLPLLNRMTGPDHVRFE